MLVGYEAKVKKLAVSRSEPGTLLASPFFYFHLIASKFFYFQCKARCSEQITFILHCQPLAHNADLP